MQIIFLCSLTSCTITEDLTGAAKRSPLEFGLVSFEDLANHPSKFLRSGHHSLIKSNPYHQQLSVHHHHEWISGHVHNHAFIPAHAHNVFIPSPLPKSSLIVKSVHNVIVPYRTHYGGFGIGVNTGGPGAGHGYHVIF